MDKDIIENEDMKAGRSMYFAVIGNIIDSKNIADRFRIDEKLEKVLDEINKKYSSDIALNFTLTADDEFQGLLTDSIRILELIDRIKIVMEPVDIRFGIGIGEIDGKIESHLSINVDGPAFWNAKEALNEIHNDDDYGKARILMMSDENKKITKIMNENLRLCDYIESRWRETQKEVVEISILNFGYDLKVKQKDLAEMLNLSTQALNQRVQSSGYYNYIRARKEISEMMSLVWKSE